MRIGIVGTRGVPANYGGFETFAQEISPLLSNYGLDVTVYCDYKTKANRVNTFKGVKLRYQQTTKSKHSLLFYLEGIWLSLKENDVILVAGTGGSFFYFLNVFFRRKIVTNTDGVESRRAKWSRIKRFIIKLSETLAVKLSTHLIADSKGIKNYLLKTYPDLNKSKVEVIEYGAVVNNELNSEVLEKYSLSHKNYYLVVSRLEPENNLHLIVEGFKMTKTKKPLIIIGNKLENQYVKGLLSYESEKIKFLDGIYNQEELMALRFSTFAYIHGHSVGGTNPSLLEALGSRNISICHDNIFNREVTDDKQIYFDTPVKLKTELERLESYSSRVREVLENHASNRIEEYYTWEKMAEKYIKILKKI
jgi:glycosyltransferase involved in cell wall biosynthesis